ncbi:MAG: 3-dehydroquinate synthase family protein, partial [Bacillota bacterium]
MRNKLKVNLDKDSYEIIIDKDILDKSGQLIDSSLNIGSKILIISDQNVYPLYGEKLKNSLQAENYQVQSQIIEPGEKSKSSHELNKIYDLLLESRFDRNSTIIALGGGVVGDLAGMAAATFMRGINFIQIPTSLLAQVDSSVGGKVAINHPEAKNIIGAFYQPEIVIIDIDLLNTLKPRDYNTGLAEVIKYGFGFNQDLFTYIENNIPKIKEINPEVLNKLIYNCCQIKSHIVNQDEEDVGAFHIVWFLFPCMKANSDERRTRGIDVNRCCFPVGVAAWNPRRDRFFPSLQPRHHLIAFFRHFLRKVMLFADVLAKVV